MEPEHLDLAVPHRNQEVVIGEYDRVVAVLSALCIGSLGAPAPSAPGTDDLAFCIAVLDVKQDDVVVRPSRYPA